MGLEGCPLFGNVHLLMLLIRSAVLPLSSSSSSSFPPLDRRRRPTDWPCVTSNKLVGVVVIGAGATSASSAIKNIEWERRAG